MSTKNYSYGRQTIEDDDIQAVIEVLKSDWLTQGPTVRKFEDALCKKFGSNFSSVVCNGTAALHLTAIALGWKENDIIITSPITFAASANCILYSNAKPDFVDIDPISYTIDPNKLEEKIKFYLKQNKKIKGVIAVDYAGHPCDWTSLKYLAEKYEFQIVNDNCHALGAKYKDDYQYAIKYADVIIHSYHPVKHITTGEGGAILTNDKELHERIKILRTHGITNDEELMEKNDGPWYAEMQMLGFNYRITDFQCALGLNQLKKIDLFLSKRKKIAEYYDRELADCENIILPKVSEGVEHAYHLYPIQIKFDKAGISKKNFFEKMKQKNIKAQVHYIPVHLHPYYRKRFAFKESDFPIAEEFYSREVSIPVYPSLEEEDLNYICNTIKEILS